MNIPRLTRRDFLRLGNVGIAGCSLLPMLKPRNVEARESVEPRGGAEVCILIFLQGAPSQMETFDVKEGPGTPDDLGIRTITPGLRMPAGTLPRLSDRTNKYTIIRSLEAWELDHKRGDYYLQTARKRTPALRDEVPSVGAVIAYEKLNDRKETDFLPPFINLNVGTDRLVGSGLLPPRCGPMTVRPRNTPPFVLSEGERAIFGRRRDLLKRLDSEWRAEGSRRSSIFSDLDDYYQSAYLLGNPKAASVFTITEEDKRRFGKCSSPVLGEEDFGFGHLGYSCAVARNIVQADAGTKFIIVNHSSWDLHSNAFDKKVGGNQYKMNAELDTAVANLLDDLEARTDDKGRRLIDKTLVVCMGEFGRTPGPLNAAKGRDHHKRAFVGLFAGAGVKPGQVIGGTDELADRVTDPGWHKPRSIYPEDVIATIYSTMGIDWTKKITETPSGQHFEYINPLSPEGLRDFGEIPELFG